MIESRPMKSSRSTFQIAAWIASLAMLLAALAPTVSHALAASAKEGSLWTEICTAAGIKLVKSDDGAQDKQGGKNRQIASMEHCPYCLPQGAMPGLPAAPLSTLPAASGNHSRPILYYHAPRPLFVWASAQSRAPPVFL